MTGSFPKTIGIYSLAGFLLYSALMIMVRLKMTEMAYEFETLKAHERRLHEEQFRLRATLGGRLSPRQLKAEGFEEPSAQRLVNIP